jgi:restriction system protein
MWPVLLAVRRLGGAARIEEIDEAVIEAEDFTDEQLAELHKDGPRTEIEYRLAWSRTYLKKMGMLTNETRGTWAATALGWSAAEEQIEPLWRECLADIRELRRRERDAAERAGTDPDVVPEGGEETSDWREELLEVLLAMDPSAFERLAERLLRAAGFIETDVTGRSGDGGIDGVGTYLISLMSFPVYFQCKRYRGSVGPEVVREFRGAIAGRGDRGLLITTGTFTRGAIEESKRERAGLGVGGPAARSRRGDGRRSLRWPAVLRASGGRFRRCRCRRRCRSGNRRPSCRRGRRWRRP